MPSPTSSIQAEELLASSPNLETLVSHLLSAKRSLSCVEHVSHANDFVTNTRQALQKHAVLAAETQFIRDGSMRLTTVPDHAAQYASSKAQEAGSEFEEVIAKLDAAETRLRTTLEQLKSTIVDPRLRPPDEELKCLADFVDETGVQTLMNNIKQSIQATSKAQKTFNQSIRELSDGTARVKELLCSDPTRSATDVHDASAPSPVPEILQTMEIQAGEMAKNLESLVSHFDLCVTAIKHTEGGGAAFSKIAKDLPDGMDLGIGNDETPLEPIGEEEMREMLGVLENDAAEVDAVVAEIRGAITDVETNWDRVAAHGNFLAEEFSRTTTAFHLLEEVSTRMPDYVTQSEIFTYYWHEERSKIVEYMNDLEELRAIYANFLLAYDNLLIEVGRRKDVEKRISKIRQEALLKIDRLVQEEIEQRQAFRQEQGDFLPIDIWPGLTMSPAHYEFNKIEHGTDSIPDISASVINKAIKRVMKQRNSQTDA